MASADWSRGTMLLNSLLFYPAVIIGGYVLWDKSSPIFWAYIVIWLGILVLGRYYVCRRCKYYGRDCPTFGFSYLACMFRRDESQGFSGRACHIDIFFHMVGLFIPVLAWIMGAFNAVVSAYGTVDHALMGAYVVLVSLMMGVHSATGCNKCDIAGCRFSGAARESRAKPEQPSQ